MIAHIKKSVKALLLRMICSGLRLLLALLQRFSFENAAYPLFSKYGYHLLRKHYYLPIPEEGDLAYQITSELKGIDLDAHRSFEFLDTIVLKYKAEFNAFPYHKTDVAEQFYLLNGGFMAIDGNVYYALIRHLQPDTIVEIGSGNSTLLAIHAISRNLEENRKPSALICIEPDPSRIVKEQFPSFAKHHAQKVQDIGVEFFESLQAGDILFIDSTHALRSGGDVWWEYCEILPRLRAGVYVHIHDISLPKPYPRAYFDRHYYWNEQYLLQAFLTFNSNFEIIWPGNYLMTRYSDKMQAAFAPEYELMRASYPSSEPTSFWMRVK